jgi:hypothetical protein
MKYCYHCNHITPGEPLYCNACGRSYGVKRCPRGHENPRSAQACSQCGSRDLSTPQPRVPWWAPVAQFLLSLVPGVLLGLASITVLAAGVIAVLRHPEMIVELALVAIPFGILWWAWTRIPAWFRTRIYRLLRRRGDHRDEGGH